MNKGPNKRTKQIWLRDQLSEGPRPLSTIKEEAKAFDISLASVYKAKLAIGIETSRQDGKLYWHLPSLDGQASRKANQTVLDVILEVRDMLRHFKRLLNANGITSGTNPAKSVRRSIKKAPAPPEGYNESLSVDDMSPEQLRYATEQLKNKPLSYQEVMDMLRFNVKLHIDNNLQVSEDPSKGLEEFIKSQQLIDFKPIKLDKEDVLLLQVHAQRYIEKLQERGKILQNTSL